VLLNRAGVRGHAALAARVLRPSPNAALRARVQELTTSRADMVGAAQDQLERIERDLHDGAQARLVALAMELGMAEEDLERNPEAAAVAVRKARDEALNALAELRDLSRGIRPALLRERGLGAALEALSARTPLPTRLEVDRAVDRLPEAVQTAAYYVVAEALTNAAKHAHAYRVLVELERRDSILTITVSDDGVGGADPEGSGLAGLRTRVRALDGRLEVQSPSGGPTVVRAEIPCG
jgi:signal transduction histidine kinase